ncbi:MAG TPA: aldo/keto reductase [Pyrinomonadaceae bacterium]|jgi:aryl-alcohol dehydrogenase-like predicted oxidoreductase|nr:aldo/keto reductase [Pyrinomonadaceae bacterium]
MNCATTEGTARYIDRFAGRAANGHFREAQGLALSSIGIGTYLGNPDAATDAKYTSAVVRAVQLGVNVIDSAANYRFQRSERSIGQALKSLTNDHGFQRDELVVCTKGGYLPFDGAPPQNVREYVNETFVKPGIASFEDIVGGAHCMTPSYLQNQLDQSLRNMDLDCVDVYYIHNPESQLGHVSESEFYERLKLAFERLEQNRRQGKLAYYGVATWNGFRATPDSGNHHSLVRMVEIATEIAGDQHGFRFIQLPFNLAMPEALSLANETIDGEVVTVLEAAFRSEVTVVVSASMLQGRVARGLPEEVRQPLGSLATDAQTAIQFVRSTPGVTTALVGMSSVEHVEENLELAEKEPITPAAFSALWQ